MLLSCPQEKRRKHSKKHFESEIKYLFPPEKLPDNTAEPELQKV